jgi:uracil phosphoribosyltransferase
MLTRTPVVVCLSGSIRALKHLFTQIRDAETGKADFVKYSNRLMTLLW